MLNTKPIPLYLLSSRENYDYRFVFGPRVQALLQEPFGPSALKKRIMRKVKNNTRAEVAYYIDLRDMAARLDEVVGPTNWSLEFPTVLDAGDRIVMVAAMRIGDSEKQGESEELKVQMRWGDVTKKTTRQWKENTPNGEVIVTEVSEEPIMDPRDPLGKKFLKAPNTPEPKELVALRAGPNAAKRAAVLYGLGAYLYRFKEVNTYEGLNERGFLQNENVNWDNIPDFARPTPPSVLVLRELGNLLGIVVPANLKELDKGDAQKLQEALTKYWGLESVRDLTGPQAFQLAGNMARISDFMAVNPQVTLESIANLGEKDREPEKAPATA